MNKKELFTIPNLLSSYRLITFPLVAVFAFMGDERLFAIFFCINLITDILDGLIARLFNMKTELGAKLDSLADIGLYINALIGGFVFKWNDIEPHLWIVIVFMICYALMEFYAFVKFKSHASFHLYSSKIGGYIQGTFFFVLFAIQFVPWLFYLAMVWGVLSFIEVMLCTAILKQPKSNVKGLYWLRKALKD